MDSFSTLSNPDPLGVLGVDQQQQAKLAAMQTAEQQKALLASYDPANVLAGQKMVYANTPDAPALKFGTTATDPVLQFGELAGNGINNFYAMRQYKQQQQQAKDMASQYNAANLKYQDMATQLAQQQAETKAAHIELANRSMATLNNPDATPEEKQQAMANLNTAMEGTFGTKFGETMAPQLAHNALAQETGTAEGQKTVAEKSAILKHAIGSGYGPGQLEVGGVPQPGRMTSFKYMTGTDPVTSQDITRKDLENQQTANTVAAQPAKLEREAVSENLSNSIKAVEAKYADAKANIDVLTGQGRLEEAEAAKKHLDEGRGIYDQAVANYEHMTAGQVKLFNSQMKSLKLPYELPEKEEKKLTAVTNKGKVTQFYDAKTGQAVKPTDMAPPAPVPAQSPAPAPKAAPAKAKPKAKPATPSKPLVDFSFMGGTPHQNDPTQKILVKPQYDPVTGKVYLFEMGH